MKQTKTQQTTTYQHVFGTWAKGIQLQQKSPFLIFVQKYVESSMSSTATCCTLKHLENKIKQQLK